MRREFRRWEDGWWHARLGVFYACYSGKVPHGPKRELTRRFEMGIGHKLEVRWGFEF